MAQIDKPNTYFNTVLYTGNNTSQSVTGVGFQPDWVWLKERNGTEQHNLYDSVRGVFKRLMSDATSAEYNSNTQLTSFDSDGFSVGSSDAINDSGNSMVGWNWKAGGTAVSNTAGSITSSVSANPTAGFSIVTFTGTGANATVGHGLGVKPDIIIIKTTNNAEIWRVYSSVLGATQGGSLDESVSFSGTGSFNSTEPTSNVFTVSGQNAVGASSYNYVAYCFADVKGFSKFGSYVGNGANDGTFVYTGFKPAFVMMKNASQGGKWLMMDNKRPTSGGNPNNARLFANVSNVESTSSNMIDMLSNGFKLLTGDTDHNASGDTNIYMAFAEAPLVGSNNVPANAR